jgi:hypothetical protein
MKNLLAGFSPPAPRAGNGEYADDRHDDANGSGGRLGAPREAATMAQSVAVAKRRVPVSILVPGIWIAERAW